MANGKYKEWLTPEGLTILEGWARDGLIDEQIAKNMGIKRPTLYEWKKRFPDISNALKKGKEVVDREVENKLFVNATGFEYWEETQELMDVVDPETGHYKKDEFGFNVQELKTTKRVKKFVKPDTTAQIFWLKNRRPDLWRDKQEVNLKGDIKTTTTNVDLSSLSIQELKALAKLDG